MTNEEEKYELIERYVNRLLSDEERSAFEAEMLRDPELRRDVNAYTEAQELIVDQGVLNVKLKLQEIHQSEVAKVKGKKYYLSGAVLVMVSATLMYLLFTNTDPVQPVIKTNVVTDTTGTTTVQPIASTNETGVTAQTNTGVKTNSTTNTNVQTPDAVTTQNPQQTKATDTAVSTASQQKTVTTPVNNDTPKDPEPAKNDPPKTDKIDCAKFSITGSATTSASCSEKTEGTVIVNLGSVKGGTRPYKFTLDEEDGFRTSSQFTDLAPGVYTILVQDKNGCKGKLNAAEVKATHCIEPDGFTPDVAPWTIPVKNFSGELRILNKANQKVYGAFIKNGYPESWNGNDNNGMPLPSGVYKCMFISEQGQITQLELNIAR